jgi:hypothetical protein
MVKVSDSKRQDILKDKATMSIKQLCDKHSLSKATVHRVLASSRAEASGATTESTSRVEVPTLSIGEESEEFINVMTGNTSTERILEQEKKEDIIDTRAMNRLAENLFEGDDDEPITQRVSKKKEKQPLVKFASSDEAAIERNALEQRIILNIENFAPIFHFIKDKDAFIRSVPNKSMAELQSLLKTLENTRTTVNLSNQMKNTFYMATRGTEMVGMMFLGLKTQGFTEQLMTQQQELDMIFREIAIDYAPMFAITTKPELRLGMIFAMTLMQTDSTNRLKEAMRARQSFNNDGTQSAPDIKSPEQRYSDL